MPRDLALSNGRLLVMFDRRYRIRDLTLPHAGKESRSEADLAPGLTRPEWATHRGLPSGTMAEGRQTVRNEA